MKKKRRFQFFRQMTCTHVWKKDASFYQLHKDDDKVHWICTKCDKHIVRDRWLPPE